MHVVAGVALIASAVALALVTVFFAWHRLPTALGPAIVGCCGALAGAGALLVQSRAGAAEWVVTLVTLAFVSALQARLLFGRPGAGDAAVVAPGPDAA